MKSQIQQFWSKRHYVLFGMSRKKESVSREVYTLMTCKGYDIYPINPNVDEIDGIRCYRHLADINAPIDGAVIITNPTISHQVVRDCEQQGITDFWFQYNTLDDALKTYMNEHNLNFINSCVLLHHKESPFPHSVHRFFYRLFNW
ncbi:CoA-binding protein [candidate division KSB1 bacterium]|nr:CoA-binding protein [candidate division KSB1 bacterium]